MKNIILFSLAAIATLLISCASTKNSVETAQFTVAGNCGSCESRIEKAAYEAGAKSADWNQATDILTVTFNPSKTNTKTIKQAMANVGHDTDEFKSDDETYQNLPGCCQYRDGTHEEHMMKKQMNDE